MCDSLEWKEATDLWQNEWRCSWKWSHAHWDWKWRSQGYEISTATAGSSNTEQEQSQDIVELEAHDPWTELSSSSAPGSEDLDSIVSGGDAAGEEHAGAPARVNSAPQGPDAEQLQRRALVRVPEAEQTGGTDLLESTAAAGNHGLDKDPQHAWYRCCGKLATYPSPLPRHLACEGS